MKLGKLIPFEKKSFFLKSVFYNGIIVVLTVFMGLTLLSSLKTLSVPKKESEIVILSIEAKVVALEHRRNEKDLFLNIGNVEKQEKYLSKLKQNSLDLQTTLSKIETLAREDSVNRSKVLSHLDSAQTAYKFYKEGLLQLSTEVMAEAEEEEDEEGNVTTLALMTPQEANGKMKPIKEHIYAFVNNLNSINDLEKESFKVLSEKTALGVEERIKKGTIKVIVVVAVILLFTFLLIGSLRRSTKVVVNALKPVLDGDFTHKIEYENKDEFTEIINSVNIYSDEMADIFSRLSKMAQGLETNATELNEVSNQNKQGIDTLNHHSESMLSDTSVIVHSTEKVSSNAETFTTNITTLVSAIEEMNITINEVTRSCQKEAEISQKADQEVKTSKTLMTQLSESSKKINKAVGVISEISEQTKLLALNASIEAASAGEAGKGFAVVADEVKQLASQSANATNEITKVMAEITERIDKTIESSDNIGTSIVEVNNISHTIITAVEEQGVTTNEISRNVTMASEQAKTISDEINESYTAVEKLKTMAEEIQSLARNSSDHQKVTVETVTQIENSSESLKSIIDKFKV